MNSAKHIDFKGLAQDSNRFKLLCRYQDGEPRITNLEVCRWHVERKDRYCLKCRMRIQEERTCKPPNLRKPPN